MAYILGALPFSVWISQVFFQDDIRRHGSGNAGSTNMYRTFGVWAGLSTQLLDIAKGVLAAALPLLLVQYAPEQAPAWLPDYLTEAQLGCGLMAVLGHVYSFLAGFKGGKGVNTMLGMMISVTPQGSLVAVGTFIVMLLTFRMVSAGSMAAVLAFNLYEWGMHLGGYPQPLSLRIVGLLLLVLVVYTHRTNISRIRQGTERKVNLRGKKASA
ncbi:MAG: glycerol-3-phosphate 1-O-acyltransferase PlsY [Bacteroidetes bacterium]|nr:glycerol-3-phosphate 1-O-acyltransferase PlsY [Bacteroidota bacterium]